VFLHSGATAIRSILAEMHQEDQLEGVLKAYVLGLTHCFTISVACSAAAFVAAATLEWKSVKKEGKGKGDGTAKVADVETADAAAVPTAVAVDEEKEEGKETA